MTQLAGYIQLIPTILECALHYYLQASRNALSVLALDDALAHAKTVQRLAGQMGENERAIGWQIEALVKIAEVLVLKSEYEAALTTCDEGEKLCQIVGLIEQYAYLLYWRGIALIRQGHESQAIGAIKQALNLVSDVPMSPRLLGLLYSRLSWLLRYFPLAEVLQYLEKALSIAQIHDLPEIKAKTLRRKAWVEIYRQDKPIQAHKLGQDSLVIAQKYNMVYEKILSHRIIAFTYHRLRRFDSAFSHCEEAVRIARQSGLPIGLHIALESMGVSWLEAREDWQKSLKAVREAIAVAEEYNFPPTYTALAVWFKSTFGLGQWQEAQEALKYRLKLMAFNQTEEAFYSWRQGHIAYAQGRFKESVNLYEKALLLFNRLRSDERDSRRVQPYLGLALVAKGDLPSAIKHLDLACAYWQGRHNTKFAQSLRALARINLIQGETTQAVARLREALAVADNSYEEENVFPVWPCTCIDLGRALLATGETSEALQHALAGYDKFKKWGHFLLGEAAFVVGQILMTQGKQDEALTYLHSARNDWQRLGLTHHLPAWQAFMHKHGLV